MPKFLTASVVAVYLYAVTILTRYGYASYFSLPSDFVTSSLKENIIFFFQLLQIAFSVVSQSTWTALVILAVVGLILLYLYFRFIHRTFLASIIVIGIGISILFGFYHFGNFLAANSTSFYTLTKECPSIGSDKTYVVADMYDGKAMFVPIDPDTHKLGNGFVAREIATLGCKIEMHSVGKINK